MKAKYTIFLLFVSFTSSFAQIIFSENMGTPLENTSIASNTFQNSYILSYSNGEQINPADVRFTNSSSTTRYAGASGGGNVYFSSTSGTYGFSIEGINASNYTNLSLQFGYRKESASAFSNFSVDFWDGSSWVTLANTPASLFNEPANASAGWYLSKALSLPNDAQINGLKIRFFKMGTIAIRIDDVKLAGIEIAPIVDNITVTTITTNSATFAGDVLSTGGESIIATGTIYSPTSINPNPTVGASGVTNLSTPIPNSGLGSFSNASGAPLLPNVQYSYNAYAKKSSGLIGYGTVATFYSLAATPSAPIVSSSSQTSLNVSIGSDSNSSLTTYAILETNSGNYVQPNGTLGSTAVYQTSATWGIKTVTGLSLTTAYTFKAIAKNGAGILTVYGLSTTYSTTTSVLISTAGTLSALSTIYGTASSFTSFTASGNNLTDNVIISAPTGFEISLIAGGGSGYSTSHTIIPSSGNIPTTIIYVRLAANTPFGIYSGNVTLSSANDVTFVNVPTSSSSVAKLNVTISGITALNKVFDNNTTATLSGTEVLNEILPGDITTVSLETSFVTASFDDALIGIDKPVFVSGYSLSGSASGNYNLTQPIELLASITPNAVSDLILNSGSSTNGNTNIDYTLYQGTTLTSTGTGTNGSVGVLGFYLRDGGAAMNDADNLPTELTDLTVTLTNPANIRSARLFVGSSPRGIPVAVNGASVIHFTGLTNIVALDNDQLAVNLRITFKSTVTDNQQLGFTISGVTAKNSSSMFATSNGGGVNSVTTGDVNRIEVAGNHLEFVQQPSNSYTNTNMSPFPTVRAKDAFENIDLDVLNNVSMSSSGNLSPTPQLPNSFSNGIYEFNSISHASSGTGLILTASLPGLSSINSHTFTINALIIPTFDAVSPICAQTTLSDLPTTSNNGITGVWSPAIDNTQTTTYTFTPNPGQNASIKTLTIVVNQPTVPTFSAVAPIYSGGALNPLPTVSLNGIIGTWSPILNNTATTTYTFTPNTGQCASGTTLIITVNSTADITPTFNPIGPICSERFLSLPTTSTNNITGTWSPAVNNTATTTYTFTPNPGQGALNHAMTVTVNPTITPTFTPVTPINSGGTLSALPIISNNGYYGSWTPALDNHTTTSYLFTPTAGGCITTTTLTIVVTEPIVGDISGTGGATGSNSPTAQKYHDTQGKLEVSETGSAVYNLPIAMPPSIQNVGPVINLTYSSGQMSGIAGQGWSINSISNISRIATRRDIDGFIDGVDFDTNDMLALNGQRLLLVAGSGTYWGNGSVYQTETQSNTRIELYGTGANIYFIVTAPDGSRSWHGNYGGENAVDNTAYYITRFEDTNGNYIKYHYYKPYNKGLCIQNIQFSANSASGILPQNSIFFRYRAVKRTENAYVKGIKQEKGEILYKIEVYAGENLFRRYELTHTTDPQLGYEKVSSIQEFNGVGDSANPVQFTYNETVSTNVGSDTVVTYNNNIDFVDVKLAGDFDGDGRLDFMTNTEMYLKNFQGSTPSAPIVLPSMAGRRFLASTLKNNKLNQYQTIVTPIMNIDNIVFKYYGYNPVTNTVALEDTKTIEMDNSAPCSNACENSQYTDAHLCDNSKKKVVRYLDGDFNGDGVTEVIVMRYDESFEYGLNSSDPSTCISIEGEEPICLCFEQHHYISEFPSETLLVNLNSNASTNIGDAGVAQLTGLDISRTSMEETFVNDYDGDGKSDLLAIKPSGSYRIFSFNQLTVSPWVSVEIIGNGTISAYSTTKEILFGDYNGDGKTDIMLPATEGGPDDVAWYIYYSNPNPAGGNSFVSENHNIVRYWPNSGGYFASRVKLNNYYSIDVNKDGKSDLVRIELQKYSTTWDGYNTKWRVESYINNIGNTNVSGDKFNLDYSSPCVGSGLFEDCDHNSGSPEIPIPLVASYNSNGINNDILIIRNHYNDLTYVKFSKDVSRDVMITKVTSSGGNIVDDIYYNTLAPDTYGGLGSMSDFYSSGDSVNYPLVEIKQLPGSKAVSQLKNTVQGVIKRQYFKYHGFISDMDGMGATGFRKTARSAWFAQTSDKLIWTVSENDPSLRGAMVRSYTQLINNGISSNFSFVNSGTPTGMINKMTNSYYNNTTNGLFTIYVNTHTVEDFLTNVKNEVDYTYLTPFILEDTVISKNYLSGVLQGTTTIVKEYDNNPTGSGSTYYIGRPTKTISTIAAYSDTSSTEQKFNYTGNKLTKTEKKANNTDGVYLTEEFEYFSNGNLKKKTLSAPGATPSVSARITEFTYDTSERFVKTLKDIEGLITTNNSFDPLYGLVISTTNPLGLTTESTYDNWGKRVKETNYLGKNTYYTYSKSNGFYTTQQIGDDGSRSISVTDALGREVRNGSLNINSIMTYYNTEYDFKNRKKRKSQPYLSSSTPNQWSTFSYDEYSRVIQTVAHTGLTSTISYSGLTVTSYDGTKTTTATKNANGHIVSTSDNGGTITNSYTADGSLKTTTYDSTTISMEYDGWGRKTKLTDPSAGIYQYECNVYGEITKEITPKGVTTYNLLPTGKVDYKISLGSGGDNTNTKTTNSYDSTTKLLTQIRFDDYTNGYFTIYNYQYDAYNRLIFKDESGFLAYYQQATKYDAFGRIEKQFYSATNTLDGKQSTKWIKNTYKNGFQWQIKDDASGQVLWQSNNVNARGQIETAIMGNGTAIINEYDQYGFPSQFKHDLSANGTNIMTLNTTFEPQTGNLTHRYNSLFNRSEDFQYDNLLDRLTDYPDALGQNSHQSYEIDGRIQQNNLGTYSYDSSKKYQNNSIALTDENVPYFVNRTGIFNDDMEAKTGWLIYEPTVVSYDATTAKTGISSLKIYNTTGSEKIVQSAIWTEIDNNVPTQYTYSGWVKGTGSDAEMFLYMKTANETGAYTQTDQIISSTGSNWVYFEKTVLIPANIKNICLRLDNNETGTIWFDDLKIRKTNVAVDAVRELNISYNMFNDPVQIEDTNVDKISFDYNCNNSRSIMYYGGLETDKTQRQYRKHYSEDGSMEIKQNMLTGEVEFVTYIGGDGYSSSVVLKSDGATQEYLYLHRDYQGSIVAITDHSGNVVEKRLYDAWGDVLQIQDGQGNSLAAFSILDRGYTGHEHLQSVGLINMNGRLYDPKLHRFIQPDNFVQDPSNTQNFNRYGYVLNNPLKYTDPSGEFIPFLAVVGIGVLIAALTYTITAILSNTPFSCDGLIKSCAVGAFTAAVTFGIGSACSTITNFYMESCVEAVSNGVFQGGMAGVQGGNFWSGFAAGALSSVASSAWKGGSSAPETYSFGGYSTTIEYTHKGISGALGMNNSWGLLVFGSISGGAGAELTGGNFWQGAVTGLVVSGLNHLAHSENDTSDSKKGLFEFTSDYTKVPLVIDQNVSSYSTTGWQTHALESKILTVAGAGALSTVGSDFGLTRTQSAILSMGAAYANSYTSQFNIKFANLTQRLWYGKVTHNLFSGEITNVNFKSLITTQYKIMTTMYQRVINDLSGTILPFSSTTTHFNQFIQVIHNPIPQVGGNVRK